jgi:hypothetical protein
MSLDEANRASDSAIGRSESPDWFHPCPQTMLGREPLLSPTRLTAMLAPRDETNFSSISLP